MTRLQGDWFRSAPVQQLAHIFSSAGFALHFVGGCVRNDLMGEPISDLDLSTNALPDQVLKLAGSAGLKAVPTGIEHGTITVVVDGEGFEITTYRKDVETDGRRAVVAFASTMEEDAHRRDFTMNALYADAEGRVIDPLGGLPDLLARRVRFIDNAGQRIREDYLRILRFFRFHAWYGDVAEGPDAEALSAIAENLGGLGALSKERVGAEMRKLLSAPDPAPSVALMSSCGVLGSVLPGADATYLAVLVHLEGNRAPDPMRRLAILGGEVPEDRLRLSRKEARRYAVLRDQMGASTSLSELAYRDGADIAHDVALLRAAMMGQALLPDTENLISRGARAVFPVKPADLMPDYTGPELGAHIKTLEARWIASGFTLTREELLK
ncbi:poly(A) polymerase [Aliiroseovarius crassostreae]|uniref:Poly(A) polymerase n=1 Tax=Aliiroseovarius crassostreae TaxID=154981 RepID=A0A0N8IAY4_9RHOB|nr:CCA tRNA nucleotidyltransferase [Aliiroseovarius crassostreae]KPN61595.1 poly(A) polymerase [Aliiroseovarius crassostreae]SFU56832.1 poly(A) polymerase [Aliiroseovarius crassostreae]